MQVIHCPTPGEELVLADQVSVADSMVRKSLGLMGARPPEAGEAIVMRFRGLGRRRVHSMFVRASIDVVWVHNERVTAVETISPWSIGYAEQADTIVELPAGAAADLSSGSVIRLTPGRDWVPAVESPESDN